MEEDVLPALKQSASSCDFTSHNHTVQSFKTTVSECEGDAVARLGEVLFSTVPNLHGVQEQPKRAGW